MRILYFSRSVPPGASGSAIITANLAKQFSPEEMVVIGAWFIGSPPVRWERRWPRIIYATLHPADGWRGGRAIRWIQFPWLLLRALWAARRCDTILATYPDEIYLMAAYFTSVITGRPLYLYFHNTYLEHDRGNLFAEWLQPRAFARARHTFVMSKGMVALYHRYYPDLDCSPLVHSFNEDLPQPVDTQALAQTHSPLQVALSGGVNASNIGAVRHMAQVIKALPDAHMKVYSKTNLGYLANVGIEGPDFTITTVSRDVLLDELGQADIVFLPHGFSETETEEEIQTIFPTRTIEYLICGRPILAHLPADCFLADFLREHDCALLVTEPDTEALQAAVERLRNEADLRQRLVANALKAARQFHAPQVAARLREVLQTGNVELSAELS
ncbi:MAG: glycosyltransferase [Anaerolineae bacterium]|nr:glycosyltransferase [Anaerolineae bacterium]